MPVLASSTPPRRGGANSFGRSIRRGEGRGGNIPTRHADPQSGREREREGLVSDNAGGIFAHGLQEEVW